MEQMPQQYSELNSTLQSKLGWHGARIKFLGLLIISFVRNRSISYSKNAVSLSKAETSSNLRRIQRFFTGFAIDFNRIAFILESLIPIKVPYTLSLDRTNWQFAGINFNILCLSIVADGVALPLLWVMLDKRGNSNQTERINLINRFIFLFGADKIDCIIADREFVGENWFNFLEKHPIKFYIRIRENIQFTHQGKEVKALWWFNNLPLNQVRFINKPVLIKENWVYLTGMKVLNKKKQIEFLIVATYYFDSNAMKIYAQRWTIECFFKAIKSAGFNIEQTHLTDAKRLEKLFAIIAIAFVWIYKIGQYQNQHKSIKTKSHGRREFSIFRYGLDNLSKAVLFDYQLVITFIKLLSCT
jgi:Transposase DDE domain